MKVDLTCELCAVDILFFFF